MKSITLDVLLRSVLGRRVRAAARRARRRDRAGRRAHGRCRLLMWVWPRLQGVGPWRRFRASLAYARRLILEEIAAARRDPRLSERDDVLALVDAAPGSCRTTSCSIRSARCCWRVTTRPRPHSPGRSSGSCATRRRSNGHARTTPIWMRRSRRRCACGRCCPRSCDGSRDRRELAAWRLPAGMTVMASARLVQLSPAIFPRPLQFRPERFLEGEGSTYSWIPFGGGTRRCLGAAFASFHMRVVLRTVLRQIELARRPHGRRASAQRSHHADARARRPCGAWPKTEPAVAAVRSGRIVSK